MLYTNCYTAYYFLTSLKIKLTSISVVLVMVGSITVKKLISIEPLVIIDVTANQLCINYLMIYINN
jgi:hypothetical protein